MKAILLLLLVTSAYAQAFKWTDEKGRVNYGDTPPSFQGAQGVRTNRNSVPATVDKTTKQRLNDEEIDRLARSRSSPQCVFKYEAGNAVAKRNAEEETFRCMRLVVQYEYKLGPSSGKMTSNMSSPATAIEQAPAPRPPSSTYSSPAPSVIIPQQQAGGTRR
jgi:hypothetical protein